MSTKSSKSTTTRKPAARKTAARKTAASKASASKTVQAGKPARAQVAAAASKTATAPVRTAARTPARRAPTRNNPSKLFASNSKSSAGPLTSEAIATDLAAFKKAGGRIEVLGNTPLRTTSTAFRSAGNTARRRPPARTAAPATEAAKQRN